LHISPISLAGSSTPVSLFENITEQTVAGVDSSSAAWARSRRPCASTRITSTVAPADPSAAAHSIVASCSTAHHEPGFVPRSLDGAAKNGVDARSLEVKTISVAPRGIAASFRGRRPPFLARSPLRGSTTVPQTSVSAAFTASTTAGRGRLVALLSR
jgi:hypothetical protein